MTSLRIVPGAPPAFPFVEGVVRGQLGLSKDEVRALRQKNLREGEHFIIHKKHIWLNQPGVAALMAAAQMPGEKTAATAQRSNADEPAGNKTTSEKTPPPEVTLQIVRNDVTNRYLVLACPKGEDPWRPKTVVRVNVNNRRTGDDMRAHLIRGMEIPARLVAQPDLYELTRPMPRKKGQW